MKNSEKHRATFITKIKTNSIIKTVSAVLSGIMMISSCFPVHAATNELKLISTSPITSGVVHSNYTWDISDGMVKASVLAISLTVARCVNFPCPGTIVNST